MNPVMEPWAERLQACMQTAGRTQADLARACKIEPGSVSGWFGKGKATKMISGDNLVACCTLLEVSPAYVMTGKGPVHGQSQVARLTGEMLAGACRMARTSIEAAGETGFDPELEPEDADLLAEALTDILENGLEAVTEGDILRFVVKVGGKSNAGRSDREDGAAGGGAGAAQGGAKKRAAGGRRR